VAAAADVLVNGPQTASIALGAVLIGLLDYRVLLLVLTAVLLACGATLARVRERVPDDQLV